MKLLVVSNMYPSALAPSYGTFVESFVRSVKKMGCRVDISVIDFPYKGLPKLIAYIGFIFKTVRKLTYFDYDCIYVHYGLHGALPLLFVSRIDCHLVINFHGTDVCGGSLRARFLRRVLRNTVANSDLIVVPSVFLKDVVIDRLHVPAQKVRVLPSAGIDHSVFFPKESRSQLSAGGIKIGYVGRLIREKGVDTLLQSVRMLNSSNSLVVSSVRIVGAGHDLERLKQLSISYNIDNYVSFEGACSRECIGDVYRDIDILVVPSRLPESLGLVVVESLACGTPVVVSNSGALKSLIYEGANGSVFESGKPDSCAQAIHKVISMICDNPMKVRLDSIESVSSFREEQVEREIYDVLKSL